MSAIQPYKPVFKHLLVKAEIAHPPKPNEIGTVNLWVRDLINRVGMELLLGPHTEYVTDPGIRGMTGIAGIKTSHLAFHIWDEPDPGFMHFDLFSCGPFDPTDVLASIDETFQIVGEPDCKLLDRENGFVEEEI